MPHHEQGVRVSLERGFIAHIPQVVGMSWRIYALGDEDALVNGVIRRV
jgi:hypothetical protein